MRPRRSSWERLFDVASTQQGLFTTQQAAQVGCSPQLLAHHLKAEKVTRIRRGIYRLVHFPLGEQDDLVAVWLWSDRQGVFSHHTALALYDLSDLLPSHVHITLPADWRRRRLRIPAGVVTHYGDVAPSDHSWVGVVPVTSVRRTLVDCAAIHLSPEWLQQAIEQALARGRVSMADVADVQQSLEAFSGRAA